MLEVPAWLLALSVPVSGLIGAVLAAAITRRNSAEANATARHSELMLTLRWAAELSVSDDVAQARLGVLELERLGRDGTIEGQEQDLIDAALEAAQYGDRVALEHDQDAEPVVLDDDGIIGTRDEEDA